MDAKQTPLIDLLSAVPVDARLVIDDIDGMGTRFIPVGRMCHEAAEALRARLAQPEPEKFVASDTWQEVKEPVLQWICVGGGGQGESNINKPVVYTGKNEPDLNVSFEKPIEPLIKARVEGEFIVADLPDAPIGSGGIRKDAQPEPEPHYTWQYSKDYTAPPRKEWQGLTDKEYEAMAEQHVTNCYFDTLTYARAIEAKLQERNG